MYIQSKAKTPYRKCDPCNIQLWLSNQSLIIQNFSLHKKIGGIDENWHNKYLVVQMQHVHFFVISFDTAANVRFFCVKVNWMNTNFLLPICSSPFLWKDSNWDFGPTMTSHFEVHIVPFLLFFSSFLLCDVGLWLALGLGVNCFHWLVIDTINDS